jgi:hypothetical protein
MRYTGLGLTLGVLLSIPLGGVGCSQPEVDDPEPPPALWPVQKAARITYDRQSNTFTLTNLAPHPIWYTGRKNQGPLPVYERQLPGGEWARTENDGCGTGRESQSLQPGKSLSLGSFPRELGSGINTGDWRVYEFVEKNGRIDRCPARIGLWVRCDRAGGTAEYVYSDGVILP